MKKAKGKAIVNATAKALTSRTVWTIIASLVLTGFQQFQPFMDANTYMVVSGILGLMATYFKVNPSQKY